MTTNYRKCAFISEVFILFGIGFLVFGLVLDGLIVSQAKEAALMTEENSDLWGSIPGKSNVTLYKYHYLYDAEKLEEILLKGKGVVQVEEKGPYTIIEHDELISRKFSFDNSSVSFKLWRYFFNPSKEEDERQKKDLVRTVNLPSLGVWYNAKNARPSVVALKALYTIYNTLIKDFFYGAIQTAMKRLPPANSTAYLSVFTDDYFSQDFKMRLTYDKDFGLFGNNNAFFVKAVLTHPSGDSRFLMDYWGLAEVEMKYLKDKLLEAHEAGLKNDTNVDLAVKQWLDLSVNQGESIATLNSTSAGFYLEYGAYIKFVLKLDRRSNLTYSQAKTLFFEFNDFGATNLIDDSKCLINKANLDKIFSLEQKQAIKFINSQMSLANLDEASNIYAYLNYVVDEVAIGRSRGGTGGTAAISDFLATALYQIFNNMGWDLYLARLKDSIYNDLFSNSTCVDALDKLNIIKVSETFNSTLICGNSQLNTEKYENVDLWIQGILYNDKLFKSLLNLTLNNLDELNYLQLINENSPIVLQFTQKVNDIFSLYQIKGNYKAMDLTPIAVNQMITGNVTESVKALRPDHYKVDPEYIKFTKSQLNIDYDSLLNVANFDKLFNGRWISDRFIEYKQSKGNSTNKFASRHFIQYLRFMMSNEILGVFITKSAYDLLWGYEDELLKIVKETKYFLGGDPTVKTKFSILNNMTEVPDDGNIWSIYTGKGDYLKLRQFKTVLGYNQSTIVMREPYFNGKNVSWAYRNPWKANVELNGTDAFSFNPAAKPDQKLWAYLDDLYRTASFDYYSTKKYNKLQAYRFVLNNSIILNQTMLPYNEIFYSEKFNGLGNMTSVFKSPIYASKPLYYQCDNLGNAKPNITPAWKNHSSSDDPDDKNFYYDSWIDVEPFTGVVLRATQKLLISSYIENDELFETEDKFIPIYSLYRTGNFTEESTKEVLGDLMTGLTVKFIFQILGLSLTTAFVSLLIFSFIQIKLRAYQAYQAL